MGRALRRRLDRTVAAGAALVLGSGVLALVAFTTAEVPDAVRRDPQAAAELVARMKAGEQVAYVAEYRFTRALADGRELTSTLFEGHGPVGSFSRSGSSLTIETAAASWDCEIVDGNASCFKRPANRGLPQSEVLRVVVGTGDYDVVRRPGETIAGEHASCYRVSARRVTRQLPDLGPGTEICLAPDGVPVRNSRIDGMARDERVALSVVRTWSDQALAPVLAGFEGATSLLHG